MAVARKMTRPGEVPAAAAHVTTGSVASAEGMPPAATARGVSAAATTATATARGVSAAAATATTTARGVSAATATARMALRQCRPSARQNHS
jgi:hypothetical protein